MNSGIFMVYMCIVCVKDVQKEKERTRYTESQDVKGRCLCLVVNVLDVRSDGHNLLYGYVHFDAERFMPLFHSLMPVAVHFHANARSY